MAERAYHQLGSSAKTGRCTRASVPTRRCFNSEGERRGPPNNGPKLHAAANPYLVGVRPRESIVIYHEIIPFGIYFVVLAFCLK